MKGWWFIGLVAFGITRPCCADIDYLFTYNVLWHRDDLNGIGQTFTATDALLRDASILLVEGSTLPQAHFQVRRGAPGNFDGSSGNVLFNSSVINFAILPRVGTAFDSEGLYELKLSDFGLSAPLTLTPGQTYSLVIVDGETTGAICYAERQTPGLYSGGGEVGHNRAYSNTFWAGPYTGSPDIDIAFKVLTGPTSAPEPSGWTFVAALLPFVSGARRARKY